jgi:hypothetical protein
VISGLYMAYLGFHAVVYVAEADMLAQPKLYLSQILSSCFLKYCVSAILKESCDFKNGGCFELLNLTEGKARSRRIDWVYYDEEASANEDALNASEGTLSVSDLGMIRHGSTPVKGSIFETNIKRLQQIGAPVSIRPWQQLHHIKLEHIQRMKAKLPAWFFRQEYECSFEAAQGKVFEHVVEGPFDLSDQKVNYQRHYIHFGLDWNPVAGHYLVGSRWSDDYLRNYVLVQKNLGTDLRSVLDTLIEILRQNPYSYLEIEDGGTNMGYCDALFLEASKRSENDPTLTSMLGRIVRRPWDSAGKNKHNTITMLLPTIIYVDRLLTPEVADWFDWATWDDTKAQPTLLKSDDQHPLDAYLHSAWCGRYITQQ